MYFIYLRKSRADLEAEARGEGETLKRHLTILLELAKKMNLPIGKVYSEIVSGDTISSRPEMQKVLNDVESGMWEGGLVMDVDRLARGDTMDQGLVSQTFKISGTKIITPMKIYDPNNEFDEEYFEFGLFMSRREYKTINRRLQRGRLQSIKEGKYVGNVTPYGYDREKIKGDKGYKLVVNPNEAKAVKIIYDLYTNQKIGTNLIAKELDKLNIKPRNQDHWSNQTIRSILDNPVYIGKIRWGARATQKHSVNGVIKKSRPRATCYELIDGLHEPIISEEQFNQAINVRKNHTIVSNTAKKQMINPLASIIVCEKCGRNMVMKHYYNSNARPSILCQNSNCSNVSAPFEEIEKKLIESLTLWLENYKLTSKETPDINLLDQKEIALKEYIAEKGKNETQLAKLHDLLEQGVYDIDTFLNRSKIISERIENINSKITLLHSEIASDKLKKANNIIPKMENLLKIYSSCDDVKLKNNLLKEVLEKVTYTKTKKSPIAGFELTIYPKIY